MGTIWQLEGVIMYFWLFTITLTVGIAVATLAVLTYH